MIVLSWIKKTILLLLPLPALAGSVQAFTISSEPFTNPVNGVTPCYVDQAMQAMNQLAVDTQGSTPETLKSQLDPAVLKTLSDSITCAYQAAMMGVQKIPAVIVDKKYVVYGNTDMTGAVAEIQDAKDNS